jgi:hypothetical protein
VERTALYHVIKDRQVDEYVRRESKAPASNTGTDIIREKPKAGMSFHMKTQQHEAPRNNTKTFER